MTTNNQVSVNSAKIVEVVTAGPQGPKGDASSIDGVTLDTTNAVEGSVLTFDSSNNKIIADNVNTITSLVDGGNF
mgnify:CR=1 FL=1|tara:strand:- start:1 stop:225 length:225 start_codon:yes stop_codon:yes gene_type:complete